MIDEYYKDSRASKREIVAGSAGITLVFGVFIFGTIGAVYHLVSWLF